MDTKQVIVVYETATTVGVIQQTCHKSISRFWVQCMFVNSA